MRSVERSSSANYRFDDFELDIARSELRHRGVRVSLEPRAFDVLAHLVMHRERTVSVAELLEQVWGGAAVERGSVHRAIRLIRRTFEEILPEVESIDTIPRRGYRFTREAQPFAAAPRDHTSPDYFSRGDVLARIEAALDGVSRGSCEVILFHGPAGIGKTTTLSELARCATRRGVDVYEGRSIESTASPPYRPWLRVIRHALAKDGAAELTRGLGFRSRDFARAFPEIAVALGVPEQPEQALDAGSRLRVNDAIADWIRLRSDRSPMALLLDDLHLADLDSIRLLSYLVQELANVPILLAAAYRDRPEGTPAQSTIESLIALRPTATVRLLELTRSDVDAFTRSRSPLDWTPEEIEVLADASGGNPLFLDQLITRRPDDLTTTPKGLRDTTLRGVLRRLLDDASPDCRAMLSFACVLGREFDPTLVATGREIPWIELQAQIDELVELRILERSDEPGRVRFIHGLIPEELYAGLQSRERLDNHRRALAAILATRRGPRDLTSEAAMHALESVDVIGFEKAFNLVMEDAREAAQRLAFDDAVRRFERALTIRGGNARSTATCLVELAGAMVMGGRADQARPLFSQACGHARELDDPVLFAHAALGPIGVDEYINQGSERTSLLSEAVERLGDRDDGLKVRLLQALTLTGYYLAPERCLDASAEALALARRLGDRSLVCSSALNRSEALGWTDERAEQRALVREANEIAQHHSVSALDRGTALRSAAHESLAAGDGAAYRYHLQRVERFALDARVAFFDWTACVMRGTLAVVQGRFRDARSLIERQLELGRHSNPVLSSQIAVVHGSMMQIIGDEPTAFLPTMEGLVAGFPEISPWRASLALALAESGEPERSRETLQQLISAEFAPRHSDFLPVCAAVSAQAAHRLGDASIAERVLAELEPFDDRFVVVGIGLAGYGAVQRYLGLCAETLGQLDDAIAHYRQGIETDRAMEAWPFIAYGLNDLGRTLHARSGPGDREAGAAYRDQALQIARDLSIEGMIKRFESQTR